MITGRQTRVPVQAVGHVDYVVLVQIVGVQTDIVIDVVATVAVVVSVPAPAVAPAAEPEPKSSAWPRPRNALAVMAVGSPI